MASSNRALNAFTEGRLRLVGIAGRRLIRAIVSLLLFQLLLFVLIRTLPQNLPDLAANLGAFDGPLIEAAPAETPAEPVWEGFVAWTTAFLGGELGKSNLPTGDTVVEILAARLPRTLLLLFPGALIGFLLGVWIGKQVAWHRGAWYEYALTLGGTAFYTSFPPWLAFVLINVFGLSLGWAPPGKLIDPILWVGSDFTLNEVIVKMLQTLLFAGLAYILAVWAIGRFGRGSRRWQWASLIVIAAAAAFAWSRMGLVPNVLDILYHLTLPLAALVLLSFGETMLVMRTIMAEKAEAQYVFVARAKGIGDARVRDRHAARVAIVPVLSRFIVHLPYVIIGSFVLELLFAWDGMGQALVRAAEDVDLAVLMGVLSLVGIGVLVAHVLLDLLLALLDPRLRDLRNTQRVFLETNE